MCDYKTLHTSDDGYAVRCHRCGHIHVAFGNAILAFGDLEFHRFVQRVEARYRTERHAGCRNEKRVQLPTAASAVLLVFSVEELERYRILLAKASDALLREALFQFQLS